MNTDDTQDYNFNNTDFDFQIKIMNGTHEIQLKPEAWDDLYLEEDIFQWFTKGSIVIKSPFDTFERESDSSISLLGTDKTKLVYKFRNDARDTIYISILPKTAENQEGEFKENLWRIELECVIYDVEDFNHGNISNKMKRLYFWEKSYQMMLEKNIEFSTALVGENKNKDTMFVSNEDRALKSGEAIGELLFNDEDFTKFSKNYKNKTKWDMGDEENKLFYTSPSNYKFIDDLDTMLGMHTSDINNKFQPCLFKLERPEKKGEARQFSLMSIKDYFLKAGKDIHAPGEYQIEHLFLEEYQENPSESDPISIKKAPLSQASLDVDVKAEDYTKLKSYQIVDFSGMDNSVYLQNRFIVSHNHQDGQFNIEIKEHKTEKYQEFFKDNILPFVVTSGKTDNDRMPLTTYTKNGYNSVSQFSSHTKANSRIINGRNMLLKYYLFLNLGISFSRRGMTIRQPGRFFAISKQSQNDKEHDNKMEGQYFIVNVIHHFSTSKRAYMNSIIGIKTHTYDETTKLIEDDVIQIK
jgi:hypothetical protein